MTAAESVDVAALYRSAGFGSDVARGEHPALVVVDLTRGFTEPSFPIGADLTHVVAAAATLVDAAHRFGLPVVFTAISYDSDDQARVWRQKAPGLSALTSGSDAVRLDPRLPVHDCDSVVIKHGASAFFGTGLASILIGLRVDTLVICGATTSGCLRATVVDAVQYGFPVLIPVEAVGDRATGPHESALFDLHQKYGDVTTADDVTDYLRRAACPPATTRVARGSTS